MRTPSTTPRAASCDRLLHGLLPAARRQLAAFKLDTHTTLCTHNPLGAKGCGEAGTIGAPAAIMNAVLDALAPLGVTDFAMPATPERVWRAIAAAGRA